jgi:hypothetical protein
MFSYDDTHWNQANAYFEDGIYEQAANQMDMVSKFFSLFSIHMYTSLYQDLPQNTTKKAGNYQLHYHYLLHC